MEKVPRVERRVPEIGMTEEDYVEASRNKDHGAHWKYIEQQARERKIIVEEIKLWRKMVGDCYRENPVNHYAKCKTVAQEYLKRVKAYVWTGYTN